MAAGLGRLIAIVGGTCTGKDTLAGLFVELEPRFVVHHFSTGIKRIASEYFGMRVKNRKLLQSIGLAMRKIDPNVWTNRVLANVGDQPWVIIADVRLENEVKSLLKRNYELIWLQVPRVIQLGRLKEKYGHMAQSHIEALGDETERLGMLRQYCKFECAATTLKQAREWVEHHLAHHNGINRVRSQSTR